MVTHECGTIAEEVFCATCGGHGWLEFVYDDSHSFKEPCQDCASGGILGYYCPKCGVFFTPG